MLSLPTTKEQLYTSTMPSCLNAEKEGLKVLKLSSRVGNEFKS